MINIRLGAFETNSSSSHAIAVSNDADGLLLDDTITLDDNGIVTIATNMSFGGNIARYNDAYTKVSYVLLSACHDTSVDVIQLLREVIKEYTGASEVKFCVGKACFNEEILDKYVEFDHLRYHYIDHNSLGRFDFSDRNVIRNFIFNQKSWLYTGRDGGTKVWGYFPVDDESKFKYELRVENMKNTIRYENIPCKHEIKGNIDKIIGMERNDYVLEEWYGWTGTCGRNLDSFSRFDNKKIILYIINESGWYKKVLHRTILGFSVNRVDTGEEIDFNIYTDRKDEYSEYCEYCCKHKCD